MQRSTKLAARAAGKKRALGGGFTNIGEVFHVDLYTGNNTAQTITNGVDLVGKGGMVHLKSRSTTHDNILVDTVRGRNYGLSFGNTAIQSTSNVDKDLATFNGDGFSLAAQQSLALNVSGANYSGFTWRKASKFFDIVTWTGDGTSNRVISHALACEVGMIKTKSTSVAGNWNVFHMSATGDLVLNSTAAQTISKVNIVSANATTFTVSANANLLNVEYVAYLYAHDTSVNSVIKAGVYTYSQSNVSNIYYSNTSLTGLPQNTTLSLYGKGSDGTYTAGYNTTTTLPVNQQHLFNFTIPAGVYNTASITWTLPNITFTGINPMGIEYWPDALNQGSGPGYSVWSSIGLTCSAYPTYVFNSTGAAGTMVGNNNIAFTINAYSIVTNPDSSKTMNGYMRWYSTYGEALFVNFSFTTTGSQTTVYTQPVTTTGSPSTAVVNGTTLTFPGGVGGPASYSTQTVNTGSATTGTLTIPSGGSIQNTYSVAGNNVELGFEPQYLEIKPISSIGNWSIVDQTRGLSIGSEKILRINTTDQEGTADVLTPHATGFSITNSGNADFATVGQQYAYLAIKK